MISYKLEGNRVSRGNLPRFIYFHFHSSRIEYSNCSTGRDEGGICCENNVCWIDDIRIEQVEMQTTKNYFWSNLERIDSILKS